MSKIMHSILLVLLFISTCTGYSNLMAEYTIGKAWSRSGRKLFEVVTTDQLQIIGCIGATTDVQKIFPLPLLAVNGIAKINKLETETRINGLLQTGRRENHLISGHSISQVRLNKNRNYGEGGVYLDNNNTEPDTWGYIFENPFPFNPELELGFVVESGDHKVLYSREFDDNTGLLIYADRLVLDALGNVHRI